MNKPKTTIMATTKGISITGSEIRVKADAYRKTVVVVEDPEMNGLLQAMSWDDIVDFVRGEQVGPNDVFTDEQLERWANQNGYVKSSLIK